MHPEQLEIPAALRRHTVLLAALAAGVYLLLCARVYLQIVHTNGGHFAYAQDDPYIHLALSQGLAHGHYGINPGEPASPSSSVIWPLLLASVWWWTHQVYAPLLPNLFAGLAGALLIGATVARWPYLPESNRQAMRQFLRNAASFCSRVAGKLRSLHPDASLGYDCHAARRRANPRWLCDRAG